MDVWHGIVPVLSDPFRVWQCCAGSIILICIWDLHDGLTALHHQSNAECASANQAYGCSCTWAMIWRAFSAERVPLRKPCRALSNSACFSASSAFSFAGLEAAYIGIHMDCQRISMAGMSRTSCKHVESHVGITCLYAHRSANANALIPWFLSCKEIVAMCSGHDSARNSSTHLTCLLLFLKVGKLLLSSINVVLCPFSGSFGCLCD